MNHEATKFNLKLLVTRQVNRSHGCCITEKNMRSPEISSKQFKGNWNKLQKTDLYQDQKQKSVMKLAECHRQKLCLIQLFTMAVIDALASFHKIGQGQANMYISSLFHRL